MGITLKSYKFLLTLSVHSSNDRSSTYLQLGWVLSRHASLIMHKEMTGPSNVPWGAPAVTFFHSERVDMYFTHCSRSERKLQIHATTAGGALIYNILVTAMLCFIRSYALLKSAASSIDTVFGLSALRRK